MSADDVEVARLRLPVKVRGLDRCTDYLTDAYGEDLRFGTEGEWMVFWRPAPVSSDPGKIDP